MKKFTIKGISLVHHLLFSMLFLLLSVSLAFSQTEEALNAEKAEKVTQLADLEKQVESIKAEIGAIDAQLIKFPRWELGTFGVIGVNFNGFSDWLARDQPNITSSTIGFNLNVFANHFTEKDFWRNSGNLNFGWIKFDDRDDDTDNEDYQNATDIINFSSLYGRKLNDKLALSVLGEYRSTILSNFNNPGYLDIGAGVTWTPIPDLVVVAHPLNYNFVFSNDDFNYESSLGAKVVADYSKALGNGVSWKSNLSLFLSYKDLENLSNWTWVNGVAFNVWKTLGVGMELGLRNNKQEALARELSNNPLQVYWVMGLSYGL